MRGAVIETASGRILDYLNPSVEDIRLDDIACGLSHTCRFASQTVKYYSVAEHAIRVHQRVRDQGREDLALAALHHDSHEAYMTDLPTPLKRLLGDTWAEIAMNIDGAIAGCFGIDPDDFHDPAIKEADVWALRHESAALKVSRGVGDHWGTFDEVAPFKPIGWTPQHVYSEFIWAHNLVRNKETP